MAEEISEEQMLSEINYIFKHIEQRLIDKIPDTLKNIIKNYRDREHKPTFSLAEGFKGQKLNKKTANMLAIIYLLYWCKNPEEKEILLKKLRGK